MDKVKCLLVDDEPVASRILAGYLDHLEAYTVLGVCKNAVEAYDFLSKNKVDLMFLDIEMPKIKGLDFLKTLHTAPNIILTTAYREYALESYEYSIIDYLLKPISFERFLKALNKFQSYNQSLISEISNKKTASLFIKINGEMKRIDLNSINYVESLGNYIKIVLDDDSHIHYSSLKGFLKSLPENFVRVHKSFLVNIAKITSYTSNLITIGNFKISISKTYQANALNILEKRKLD